MQFAPRRALRRLARPTAEESVSKSALTCVRTTPRGAPGSAAPMMDRARLLEGASSSSPSRCVSSSSWLPLMASMRLAWTRGTMRDLRLDDDDDPSAPSTSSRPLVDAWQKTRPLNDRLMTAARRWTAMMERRGAVARRWWPAAERATAPGGARVLAISVAIIRGKIDHPGAATSGGPPEDAKPFQIDDSREPFFSRPLAFAIWQCVRVRLGSSVCLRPVPGPVSMSSS